MYCASLTKTFDSALQVLNGVQFVNATFVSSLPPVTVISQEYMHQNNHKDLI